MRMTHAEFLAYEARRGKPAVNSDGVEKESDLHDEILEYCKQRGWVCIHSRMDRKTTNACGTPDFIVALTDGRTVYAEAKRKGGKLSPSQQATLAWLLHNRQTAGVVTTLQDFITLCSQPSLKD